MVVPRQPHTQILSRETGDEQQRLHERLRASEARYRACFEGTSVGQALTDLDGSFIEVNPTFAAMLGYSPAEVTGRRFSELTHPDDVAGIAAARDALLNGQQTGRMEKRCLRKDGTVLWIDLCVGLLRDSQEMPLYFVVHVIDISERKRVEEEFRKEEKRRKDLEVELSQARKLQSVGQLAAGIAHEINTPTQYVGDGIHFLKEAFAGYQQLNGHYRRAIELLTSTPGHESLVDEIRAMESSADLHYFEENVPGTFDRCHDGIARISTIVRAMKEFAHRDQQEKSPADLNRALQSTIDIARGEYKYVAEVETEFGMIPPVSCHLGDLNQVFLNLIVNAAHAIGELVGQSGQKGRIKIRTSCEGDSVRIDITDNGAGIPAVVRPRIFEPFFTTKEVGKGTGQGLPIARSIVVEKHQGTLTFETEVGKGTTFTIRLPKGQPDHLQ